MERFKKILKFIGKATLILFILSIILAYPGYKLAEYSFTKYFRDGGERIYELNKNNQLPLSGAASQILKADLDAQKLGKSILNDQNIKKDTITKVEGILVQNYPSLELVKFLNEKDQYSNTIKITDRKGREIAQIKTDHTRAKVKDIPKTLIESLLAAEDKTFFENNDGFEFESFARAVFRSIEETIKKGRFVQPKGTSTVTQQVAKLLISYLDEEGRVRVNRNIDRKRRELFIAYALRKRYSADDILEFYLNHCVGSDHGLVGVKDIARDLMGKELNELSDAECVYIARMVKWGRNLHGKISRQCRIDMPRISERLGWSEIYQLRVLKEIDALTFTKPKNIETEHGYLIDLANEFWLKHIEMTSDSLERKKRLREMNLIDPSSLVRQKGNLTLKLNIDLPLQNYLIDAVDKRGYGKDTAIINDARIGSEGEIITLETKPQDSVRLISVMTEKREFSEPQSSYKIVLEPGDTLIRNIRYRKKQGNEYRRSVYYYARKLTPVSGQYFSYCILDSKTGKLLAYYSKDRLGSKAACLLRNRIPNGSSTAKPILNALNFDLQIFEPYEKWTDEHEVFEEVPWRRDLEFNKKGIVTGVVFQTRSFSGAKYNVHNHGDNIEGCKYIIDHLAGSNNILCVETMFRLNRKLFDEDGSILSDQYPFAQYFHNLAALDRVKNLQLKEITGVRFYKELIRKTGAPVDTMISYGRKRYRSDSLYSVALGTLEMSLLEQAHAYNVFYNNDLVDRPASHPSLFVNEIDMYGKKVILDSVDIVKRYHPFTNKNNLRPTYLGMHKRLVSHWQDGLKGYDVRHRPLDLDTIMKIDTLSDSLKFLVDNFNPIETTFVTVKDTATVVYEGDTSKVFDDSHYSIENVLANYAKSGTTDDIMRPFNADVTSKEKTNYGLWNAVVRVDLSKFDSTTSTPDIRDLTVACIGEGNEHYTGPRDGKSMHRFLTRGLLKTAGTPIKDGFFSKYDAYIKRTTPDSAKECKVITPEMLGLDVDSLYELHAEEDRLDSLKNIGELKDSVGFDNLYLNELDELKEDDALDLENEE